MRRIKRVEKERKENKEGKEVDMEMLIQKVSMQHFAFLQWQINHPVSSSKETMLIL